MDIHYGTNTKFTRHAGIRMRQRGYTRQDISLVRSFGTPVNDGYVLTREDVKFAQADAGENRQSLERLIGTALIEIEGSMITVYHARKETRRRLMEKRA